MKKFDKLRMALAGCTALTAASLAAAPALAQDAEDVGGLQEIIVTAQKREQSLQDVPIAVTALGEDSLKANRIVNVVDLSGLAPGVNVRPSIGGSGIPIFAIRGTLSYGVVPGSDKQASMYLDGVYISNPRGSIFDLPDVARIEVLRGPQGTLFGRNATSGAISIQTRDPSGEAGVTASISRGNRSYDRYMLTANTPQMGAFSGYFSYLHQDKRGDIANASSGVVWNRTNSAWAPAKKIRKSPAWLGSKDSDTWFAALKFESGDFKTVYKYDRTDALSTPEATAMVGLNRTRALLGPLMGALVDSQPASQAVLFAPNVNKRPDVVRNSYAIPTEQNNQGHSLTSTYVASDSITIKNIAAYRKGSIFAAQPIDGLSALTFTSQALVPYATFAGISRLAAQGINVQDPANAALVQSTIGGIATQVAPLIGQPFIGIASAAQSRSIQYSDELQFNYDSDFLTATVGALWLKTTDHTAEQRMQNTISFDFVPGGVLPNKNIGEGLNKAKSIAGFAQAEFHVTPQLDVIVGGRLTKDKKTGRFTYGASLAALNNINFTYKDTRFTYLLGVNYKPSDDTLLYAKWSTGYVSGGSTAGIPYDAETAKSAEAGFKGQFLDNKVRTNLAVWWVEYKGVQGPQTATSYPTLITQLTGIAGLASSVGTFVLSQGDKKAKGFEFEFDAAPVDGLTLGGSLSYTDVKVSNVPQNILDVVLVYDGKQNIPPWQGALYAQYETQPLFGDATLAARIDGIWTSKVKVDGNPDRPLYKLLGRDLAFIDAYWLVNGRLALRDISLGGVKAEVAAWGRNLFDSQRMSYGLNLSETFYAANYIPARSYGVDLTISF
jgi:iron complex outermembrane receptor protein